MSGRQLRSKGAVDGSKSTKTPRPQPRAAKPAPEPPNKAGSGSTANAPTNMKDMKAMLKAQFPGYSDKQITQSARALLKNQDSEKERQESKCYII